MRFKQRRGVEFSRYICDAWEYKKAQQVAVFGRAARDQNFGGETAPQVQPERVEHPRQRHSTGEIGQTGEIRSHHPSNLFAHD